MKRKLSPTERLQLAEARWHQARDTLHAVDQYTPDTPPSRFPDVEERRRVFQIENREVRKNVIAASRQVELAFSDCELARLAEIEWRLAELTGHHKISKRENNSLLIYAGALVALSALASIQVVLVGGFLGAAWLIVRLRRFDRELADELLKVRAEAADQRQLLETLERDPILFTTSEAESGEPDPGKVWDGARSMQSA